MTDLLDSSFTTRPDLAIRTCSPVSTRSQLSTTSTISIGERTKRSQKRKRQKCSLSNAQWRSIALEKTYVHDVYSLLASKSILLNCPDTNISVRQNGTIYDRVRSFLDQHTESASIVLDLGCGDSNYSLPNDLFVMIGVDRCSAWFHTDDLPAPAVTADLVRLPFKDAFFDAILCVDVLHHLSTVRRRISALKQISRCLKIGGKVLITVRGPSPKLSNFESRDLLIRVNHFKPAQPDYEYDSEESSFDDSSESDPEDNERSRVMKEGSIKYSYSNHKQTRYPRSKLGSLSDSFTSPSSSDLDDCYAFMKRALKRLSMVRSFYAQKNDSSRLLESFIKKQDSIGEDIESDDQLFAIELRNLDPDADSVLQHCDLSESLTMESCSSSVSGPTTSSSGFFSASFLSNIREHFISWRSQFVNNSVWHSLDAKLALFSETQHPNSEPPSHRFSLPLNFLKPESINGKTILSRNKIHVYSSNKPTIVQLFSGERSLKLNLPETITSRLNISEEHILNSCTVDSQSFSPSESTHFHHNHNSNICSPFISSSCRPTHYQSLPNLVQVSDLQFPFIKRSQSMHSLVKASHELFSERKLSWFDDSLMEEGTLSLEVQVSPQEKACEIEAPVRCKSAPLNRKLLRQRSFSADYQQHDAECFDVPARRFSASPNIETHRYNNNCHTPHSQQISMDSEESFITIIPAIRSARPSITDPTTLENLTDFDEEDEIEMSENDVEDMFSLSDENDDDAYYESLSCTSTDNTSLSSGLELTVKSLSAKTGHHADTSTTVPNNDSEDGTEFSSDTSQGDEQDDEESCDEVNGCGALFEDNSSPPSILHCFYHVFAPDELESLIRNCVTDLDLLETFFEPETGTWCIVAEKIRVWTI